MKEWIAYLGEIILVTAVSGLLYHIAPEGALKKHLHFVISLCVLTALAVPMFAMVTELPETFEKNFEEVKREEQDVGGALTEALVSASKRELEEAVASYVSEKYGIDAGSISVETELNAEDPEAIEITGISIVLRGSPPVSAGEIRRALSELFLGKSKITVLVEP